MDRDGAGRAWKEGSISRTTCGVIYYLFKPRANMVFWGKYGKGELFMVCFRRQFMKRLRAD
jgi:hypothetical protein